MVDVVQLVRTPGCGPGGRGFESHHSPHVGAKQALLRFFCRKSSHAIPCSSFLQKSNKTIGSHPKTSPEGTPSGDASNDFAGKQQRLGQSTICFQQNRLANRNTHNDLISLVHHFRLLEVTVRLHPVYLSPEQNLIHRSKRPI